MPHTCQVLINSYLGKERVGQGIDKEQTGGSEGTKTEGGKGRKRMNKRVHVEG